MTSEVVVDEKLGIFGKAWEWCAHRSQVLEIPGKVVPREYRPPVPQTGTG